jgi:DNA polymerase-1
MNLLIDADYIVYKCCAACETEIDYGEDVIFVTSNFSDAYKAVTNDISRITKQFGGFAEPILFFSDSVNFRKKISPDYKGHRNRKKPCGYKRVISNLKIQYNVIIMKQLEADDAMGIYATAHPGNCIVSPDKDMKQIPGKLYNLEDNWVITEEEGAKWHLIQTLAGDQTDGYSGVPGIGVKRAETLFNKQGYSWATVVQAFEDKGLTETDALTNARLAKILTIDDYDTKRQEPKLWSPEPTFEVNSGTGLQDEND